MGSLSNAHPSVRSRCAELRLVVFQMDRSGKNVANCIMRWLLRDRWYVHVHLRCRRLIAIAAGQTRKTTEDSEHPWLGCAREENYPRMRNHRRAQSDAQKRGIESFWKIKRKNKCCIRILTCLPLELQSDSAGLERNIGASVKCEQKKRDRCMCATRNVAQEVMQTQVLFTAHTRTSNASRHS